MCCKNKILTSRSPVPTQKYHFLVHGSRGMTIPPIPPFILYDPRPVHEDSGEITPVGQQHLACHPCNPTRDMMCRAATMQPCPCHRAVTTNQPCHRCRSVLCRQRPQEDHSSSSESLRTGTGAVQLCLLWHRPEPSSARSSASPQSRKVSPASAAAAGNPPSIYFGKGVPGHHLHLALLSQPGPTILRVTRTLYSWKSSSSWPTSPDGCLWRWKGGVWSSLHQPSAAQSHHLS